MGRSSRIFLFFAAFACIASTAKAERSILYPPVVQGASRVEGGRGAATPKIIRGPTIRQARTKLRHTGSLGAVTFAPSPGNQGAWGSGTTSGFDLADDLEAPQPPPPPNLPLSAGPLPPFGALGLYLPPRCPLIIKVGHGLSHSIRTRVLYGRPGCV